MKQPPAEDDDLRDKARRLLDDSDLMRAYWDQGHTHLWDRTWQKVTQKFGGWAIAALLGLGGSLVFAGAVWAVKSGLIK